MAFQSIAEFLDLGEPGTNIDEALAALHEEVIAGGIPLIGCRCSWNHSGRQCERAGLPEPISGRVLPVLQFVLLPDDSDVVLIKIDDHFERRPTQGAVVGEVNNYGGGITWVKSDYDEKLGPTIEVLAGLPADRIHGWGELRIHAEQPPAKQTKPQAFSSWLQQVYSKEIPAGTTRKKLAQEFFDDTGIEIDGRSIGRAIRGR